MEVVALAATESLLGYHPFVVGRLTDGRDPASGHCQMGSLTGPVASERVTEAFKGSLRMVGNHSQSVKVYRELDCETYKSSRYESRT